MSTTDRLLIPLLQTAQAQKEITHNEALALLDHMVQAVVETVPDPTPPMSPIDGATYIVGASATGDWAGQEDKLALRINGAWQFVTPFDGLTVWLKFFDKTITYSSGTWRIGQVNAGEYQIDGVKVVGAQFNSISDPSGGSTVDGEARAAISSILSALKAHGLIAT
ncbi:MAG: DUF2793 domain-containing protein [Pseudomonadota bacterium]